MNRRITRAGQVALTVTAVLGALCFVVFAACLAFDVRPVVVRSGSMTPTISVGSLAVGHGEPARDLRKGQIVTVPLGTSHVTHRIVTITRDSPDGPARLLLKGDANNVPDAEAHTVTKAYVYWFSVPVLGRVIAWLSRSPGIFVLAAFVAVLVSLALRGGAGRDERPGPGPRNGRRQKRSRGRRRGRRSATVAMTVALIGSLTVPAWAAGWTDSVPVTGSTLTSYTVPTTTLKCNGLGLLSLNFTWTAVTGATGYTLYYNSGANHVDTTATSATVGSLISGGSAYVVVHRNFGSTTWNSVNSNSVSYTVVLVAVCA